MLNTEDINQIQELYQQGTLKKDIAKIVNCSLTTVSKYTKDLQVITDSMVGEKFGSLTVISRAKKNPALKSRCLRYLCICDCGQQIEVNGNSLRTGHTTSCGCRRKETISNKIEELTGQKFNNLLVLEKTENRKDRHIIWKCQCDCGKTHYKSQQGFLNSKHRFCTRAVTEKLLEHRLWELKVANEPQTEENALKVFCGLAVKKWLDKNKNSKRRNFWKEKIIQNTIDKYVNNI